MSVVFVLLSLIPCQSDYIKWAELKRPAYNEPELTAIRREEGRIRSANNTLIQLKKPKPKTKSKQPQLSDIYRNALPTEEELKISIGQSKSRIEVLREKIREKDKKPYLPPVTDKVSKGVYAQIEGRVLETDVNGYTIVELPNEKLVAVKGLDGLFTGETLKNTPLIHFDAEINLKGREILSGYCLDEAEVMKEYKLFLDKKYGQRDK